MSTTPSRFAKRPASQELPTPEKKKPKNNLIQIDGIVFKYQRGEKTGQETGNVGIDITYSKIGMRNEDDWVMHTFKDFDCANEYKWVKDKNCYQMKLHSDLQLSKILNAINAKASEKNWNTEITDLAAIRDKLQAKFPNIYILEYPFHWTLHGDSYFLKSFLYMLEWKWDREEKVYYCDGRR